MEEVNADKGAYFAYSRIPAGEESTYTWIHKPGFRGGHYEFPDTFYRKKTDAEINQDKIRISEIAPGTVIQDRMYLDTIPKQLHKHIDMLVEKRSTVSPYREIKSSTEILPIGDWIRVHYLRNKIPVELSGGRRRGIKKTRRRAIKKTRRRVVKY